VSFICLSPWISLSPRFVVSHPNSVRQFVWRQLFRLHKERSLYACHRHSSMVSAAFSNDLRCSRLILRALRGWRRHSHFSVGDPRRDSLPAPRCQEYTLLRHALLPPRLRSRSIPVYHRQHLSPHATLPFGPVSALLDQCVPQRKSVTGTCEKIGFSDFSTTHFQYFTGLKTGPNSISSHVPGTVLFSGKK
jgi:hypothetical protein